MDRHRMTDFSTSLISLALAGTALGVAAAAGRRLYLSQGRNTLLYGLVCGYAVIAGGAAAGVVALGGPFDEAASLFACGAVPLWAAARALTSTPRRYGAAPVEGPVFASCRGTLRDGAASST